MADESEPSVLTRSEPRASILLVDDTPANLLSLRAILEELGQNLVEARSGEEALERVETQEFAVILLDVLMPGISGFETAKAIRGHKRSQHTPVIFLTASDIDRAQTEEAYRLGAVDFLVKPLLPVALQAKVRSLVELFLDKQRARHEADQLRLLMQGTTDYAIFMLDPQGRVVTWNAGAERFKGYKAGEIIGQHFSKFYPQADIDRGWPAHELKVATAEGRFEDEGWRVRKDGSQFWANVVITALKDERGKLLGFSKVTRDLTARKQAEEALRQSEERFRLLVEGAKDYAIFMLDPQGRVVTWNAGAERFKGYKAGEIIGQHFSKFYPQADIDRGWPAHELKVATAEGRFEDEGWRIRKDGTQFWANVVITALRDERGELLGFSKITRDMTERKLSEENVRRLAEEAAARQVVHEERERLQVTLASIGDAVISTDANGRVDFLNPVAEELVGWKSGEASGRTLEDVFRIVNEDTRQTVENPALRALKDGVIVGLANHTILISKDGTERPIDDSAAPIRNRYGDISGSVLVFRDISERKQNEAVLRERLRLLALNAAVGEALVQGDSLEAMLQRCAEGFVEHLDAAFARIWTLNQQDNVLELRASAGIYTHLDGPHSRVPVGKYKIGLIAQERKPHLTNAVVGDPRVSDQEWAKHEGMVAFAGYPLVVADRLVGVMAMFARKTLSAATLEAMASVADEIAVGIDRKTYQERLYEQREWLSVTLASIGDAVIATDDHGRVTFLNGVAREMTGWTLVDAEGQPLETVFTIINEQTRKPVNNPVEKVLREGVIVGLANHTILVAKDGTERPIDDSAAPIRDSAGKLIGVVLIFRDVTEQRRAEKLLVCQKQALEMVAEGRALTDVLEFLVRTIEAESTTGVIAAIHLLDEAGSVFRQAIAPSLPSEYHRATRIAVHPDRGPCCRAASTRGPVTVPDVEGDPQWAAFAEFAVPLGIRSGWSTPILSSEGRVLGTFANYYRQPGDPNPQDRQLVEIVTRTAALAIERVRARDALRQSEQTARFLADASAALAVLVDFDSTLQKVASLAVPSFADWATVDLVEGDGTLRRVAVAHADPAKVELARELHRRFPPDPAAPQGVWNILRTGRAEIVTEITDELLVRSTKDGELLRIVRELGLKSYVGVPLKVRGKTLGVITFVGSESGRRYADADLATAQDLADRAAIAVENAQLYRELRDADRRKDEFLATLAHELRNPLAPIRNGLQVLRLSGPENGMVAEARSMMERQLSQMVRLVDDLLDVSRISRNKLDLKRQRVALAAVIHSAVETSRPLIEQARHTLAVTLPHDPVELDADFVRLAQVFSNLLNNSAKYTEPGGHIWLTAEIIAGREVVVRVRDTGLGIPTDALPRIFEMFSQVDRNMERAQGGLGIGLTLVRRLVEMHGGTVEARSDGPGRGSEFTVRLPLTADGVVERSATAGDDPATSSKRRILIVDDNHDSAMSLGMMLDLMGNETRTAHDGLAAVEAAEQFRPDVILLDIGLPKLNGYDACRRIREQPWSRGMVIVALTGWGQEEDRRRSAAAGFDHHMVKPVEVDALGKLLADAPAART